jgi:hypothetical protein
LNSAVISILEFISPQKNARTPEQNTSLRNLCKNFWLEETAILDMQMSKLPMISGYGEVQLCHSQKLLPKNSTGMEPPTRHLSWGQLHRGVQG